MVSADSVPRFIAVDLYLLNMLKIANGIIFEAQCDYVLQIICTDLSVQVRLAVVQVGMPLAGVSQQ